MLRPYDDIGESTNDMIVIFSPDDAIGVINESRNDIRIYKETNI